MRSETTVAAASTAGAFALDRAVWALQVFGFTFTPFQREVAALGVLLLGAASAFLWAHLAWDWARRNGWGKQMGVALIIVGIMAIGAGIYTLRYPTMVSPKGDARHDLAV